MSNYITRKHHDKVVAMHEHNAKELISERDNAIARATEAERSLEYWKAEYKKADELRREIRSKQDQEQGRGMAVRERWIEAMHRAHRELSIVKANETCEVRLQRAIGNAQGILAAVVDHAQPVDLYPDDKPLRRRASDHILDAKAYYMGGR